MITQSFSFLFLSMIIQDTHYVGYFDSFFIVVLATLFYVDFQPFSILFFSWLSETISFYMVFSQFNFCSWSLETMLFFWEFSQFYFYPRLFQATLILYVHTYYTLKLVKYVNIQCQQARHLLRSIHPDHPRNNMKLQ